MAYALIKWLDGDCAGTYTAGVPVSWIIDYDKNFMEKASKKVNVVEWRVGKKPKGGWVCYDIRIIEVSDSIPYLERQMNIMDVPESPRKIPAPEAPNDVPEASGDAPKNKRRRIEPISDSSDDDREKDSQQGEDVNISGIKPIEEQDAIKKLTNAFEQNTKKLGKIEQEVTQCLNILEQLSSMTSLPAQNLKPKLNTLKELEPEPSTSLTKEIGRKGSKVYVTEDQWFSAKSKATPTHMATTLLTQVFPLEVLLESNLKGGVAKVHKGKEQEPRKALDESKLRAILEAVRLKFPDRYNESSVRIAINNKLSSLRSKRVDHKSTKTEKSEKSKVPTTGQKEQATNSDDDVREDDENDEDIADDTDKSN